MKKTKKTYKRYVLLAVFLAAILFIHQVFIDHSHHASAITNRGYGLPTGEIDNLINQVNYSIAGYPDDSVSVSIINLSNDQQTNIGDTSTFLGASTTKVIVAADFLHQVEEGKYSLSMSLDGESAQHQLQEMVQETDINDSDNDWYDFINLLSFNQITSYGQSIGLKNYQAQPNTITASDEALVLQKLYDDDLLDAVDTNLLLSFMQHTGDENLIPAAVPSGATVYNKFGYYEGYLNDSAIITDKQYQFVLVIMTSNPDGNINDYTSRQVLFHEITEAVYRYETNT